MYADSDVLSTSAGMEGIGEASESVFRLVRTSGNGQTLAWAQKLPMRVRRKLDHRAQFPLLAEF